MKEANLADMVGGWFVGDFEPTVQRTKDFEVGIKNYRAGDVDAEHFHKIGTEITVIITGRAMMGGREWSAGDIIVVEPNETIQFRALSDVTLAVVKFPSIQNDKFLI